MKELNNTLRVILMWAQDEFRGDFRRYLDEAVKQKLIGEDEIIVTDTKPKFICVMAALAAQTFLGRGFAIEKVAAAFKPAFLNILKGNVTIKKDEATGIHHVNYEDQYIGLAQNGDFVASDAGVFGRLTVTVANVGREEFPGASSVAAEAKPQQSRKGDSHPKPAVEMDSLVGKLASLIAGEGASEARVNWVRKNIESIREAVQRGKHQMGYYPASGYDGLRVLVAYDLGHLVTCDNDRDLIGQTEEMLKQLGIEPKAKDIDLNERGEVTGREITFELFGRQRTISEFYMDLKDFELRALLRTVKGFEDGKVDVLHVYLPTGTGEAEERLQRLNENNYVLVREGGFFSFEENPFGVGFAGDFESSMPSSIYEIFGLEKVDITKRHPVTVYSFSDSEHERYDKEEPRQGAILHKAKTMDEKLVDMIWETVYMAWTAASEISEAAQRTAVPEAEKFDEYGQVVVDAEGLVVFRDEINASLSRLLEACTTPEEQALVKRFGDEVIGKIDEAVKKLENLVRQPASPPGAAKSSQIGKRAHLENIVGDTAKVKDSEGNIQNFNLGPARTMDIPALRLQVEGMLEDKEAHKELVSAILSLLEKSPPTLRTFDTLIEDLFGFASTNPNLIALHQAFANNPIALFHEISEYLVRTNALTLRLEGNTLIVSFNGKQVQLALEGETLAIAQKDSDNPHYLLRALQREIFGERDTQLTQEIKRAQQLSPAAEKELGQRLADIVRNNSWRPAKQERKGILAKAYRNLFDRSGVPEGFPVVSITGGKLLLPDGTELLFQENIVAQRLGKEGIEIISGEELTSRRFLQELQDICEQRDSDLKRFLKEHFISAMSLSRLSFDRSDVQLQGEARAVLQDILGKKNVRR